MNNLPQFKIFGKERRILKKELSELKLFVKRFWYYHQMEKDMGFFYGGTDTFPMADDKAKKMYGDKVIEIKIIENKLNICYGN